MRYKNNKFQARNVLFLYLTTEVEFGQDILQGYVSENASRPLIDFGDF